MKTRYGTSVEHVGTGFQLAAGNSLLNLNYSIMKRILSVLSIATLGFTACHSVNSEKGQAVVNESQATIDSLKAEITRKNVVDSMNQVLAAERTKAADEKVAATTAAASVAAARSTRPARRTRTVYRDRYVSSPSNYSSASSSNAAYDPAPVATKKRGWSAKAKGAVIGAGAGAIGGAIINKRNRGAGAVIGGLGGAAVGTGIGAILDKKNGR
jgi:hypothetical protein